MIVPCIGFTNMLEILLLDMLEEMEDTKGGIKIRISKNRQHNGQKKKYKRTNNDLQNTHIKPKIDWHEHHKKPGVNSGAPEG